MVDYLSQLLHCIVDSYIEQEEQNVRKEEREAIYLEHSDIKTTQNYAKPSWRNFKNPMP
ncbi:hypothetical protein ABFV83_15675 [Lacrimispora sp. BS-2]|uniref:Transposase n=1 Tax=Lacrimispora sp. BS-2 TaxID=3151850 RepID=A0AAU7PNT9_9FIRM